MVCSSPSRISAIIVLGTARQAASTAGTLGALGSWSFRAGSAAMAAAYHGAAPDSDRDVDGPRRHGRATGHRSWDTFRRMDKRKSFASLRTFFMSAILVAALVAGCDGGGGESTGGAGSGGS